jgi:hypothetical protein
MPVQTDASGFTLAPTAVRTASAPGDYTVATSVTTGGIAASIIDLGAVYANIWIHSIGGTSVSAGAVGVDGSMTGNTADFYNCVATSTAVPQTATSTITVGTSKPSRFLRLNVGTQLVGASGRFLYGGY